MYVPVLVGVEIALYVRLGIACPVGPNLGGVALGGHRGQPQHNPGYGDEGDLDGRVSEEVDHATSDSWAFA